MFPITSCLLSGVSYYKEMVKEIMIDDVLEMSFDSDNKYDSNAIVIRKGDKICGFVPRDVQLKMKKYAPCKVIVIDKHYITDGISSLRIDLLSK